MKKIWKNLCACSLVLACTGGLTACGKDETPVSKDLDGDGVVSTWETLYDDMEHSISSSLAGEITFISSADELLDINNHVEEKKVYALKNNIDLGGREVSINLGKSEFYGFNYVISNFKMATLNGSQLGESGYQNTYVKSLFRNGTGVFSTRVFMGVQSIVVDNASENSDYYISPMFNVPVVSDVGVKGKIKVEGSAVDNRFQANVNASLLYSGMQVETITENEDVVMVDDVTCIDNVNVDGEIDIANARGSRIEVNAGSIASVINKNSIVYNCYAQSIINSTSAEYSSNISGIVGHNKGFVSTCTFTGEINFNNDKGLSVMYGGGINISGIVGTNDSFGEVKNCSTNAKINVKTQEDEVANMSSVYNVGGIVGVNQSGIIELCQSDATINLDKVYSAVVGGLTGVSNSGIISYNICRGSINAKNIASLTTAQVSGLSKKGLIDKVLTTTTLNIDNAGRTTEKMHVGMVTVFQNIDESPYFRRIMVDGISKVLTREVDNSKFDFNHGLRYPYLVQVGVNEDEYIYDVILPDIYESLYRTDGCKLLKYSLVGNIEAADTLTIKYANNSVGLTAPTTRIMIDYLDFKNYVNHKEVNLDDSTINLNSLHFTVSNDEDNLKSYFGGGKYNGELAYFDKEFTKSFTHETNSLGSCKHDAEDEMLSFVYDLIKSNNGKSSEVYAIKVANSYINRAPDNNEKVEGLSADANIFVNKVCNVFGCLSTSVSVTLLDKDGNSLEEDESGTILAKYVVIEFFDSKHNYTMKLDVTNMQEPDSSSAELPDAFIVYVTFSIANKLV